MDVGNSNHVEQKGRELKYGKRNRHSSKSYQAQSKGIRKTTEHEWKASLDLERLFSVTGGSRTRGHNLRIKGSTFRM